MILSDFRVLYLPLHSDSPIDFASLQQQCKAVVSKGTLQQALQMCLKEAFHLILVDGLSTTFGVEEACAKLRKQFRNPLVVLVANSDEEYLATLHAAGVDECIVGPHNMALLAAKIHSWLKRATPVGIAKHWDRHEPTVRVVIPSGRGKSFLT